MPRPPSAPLVHAALRVALALALVAGCRPAEPSRAPPADTPRPLVHDAYVWQRAWTGAVSASVARASPALGGLRVLVADVAADGTAAWPDVDLDALARAARPVTAVVRLDGARLPSPAVLGPAGAPLAPVLARVDRWRGEGIDVAGVEIDHDAATAALPAYAAWLAAARASLPTGAAAPSLRLSITALPAWAESPALADLAAAVDELVVQVHAVRRPRIFDATDARRWLARFAAAVPRAHLRVALPTYAVTLDGARLAADPAEVAAFLRDLERAAPANLDGVVWFRLPTDGDRAAWPATTLDAVIAGRPLAARVEPRLVETGRDLHDVVLVNRGAIDAPWPALRVTGALTAIDLVGGYVAAGDRSWTAPRRTLAPGDEVVVGWATGKDLRVDVP